MANKYLDYDGLLYFWQKLKITFASISHTHTKSEITDFPTTMTPSSHTHGNIQNGGTLQTTDVAIATGDKLVITDASNSNKVARSSVSFDGSTENKALTPKGTWEEFNNYVHPSTMAHAAAAVKVGNDASGHVVVGDPLKTSDLTNDSEFITSADVPVASTTTPAMDGTASAGTENAYAKGDHVHPTDTSRAAANHGHGAIDNNGLIKSAYVRAIAANDGFVLLGAGTRQISGSTLTFDGSTTTKALTPKGTWETFVKDASYVHTDNNYTSAEKTKLGKLVFDGSDKIDSSILPSYVDDVIEAYARSGQTALSSTWLATGSASGTVITPEAGKIYVLMADSGDYSANSQFRWSGTAYVKLNDGGVSAITNAEIDTIVAS